MRKLTRSSILIAFLYLSFNSHANTNEIHSTEPDLNIHVVNFTESHFSKRSKYFIELMELALDKSGFTYKINPVPLAPYTEKRSVAFLKSGTYSIHWLNTRHDYEEELLPIRIPLFKGLIGLRLLLIRTPDKNKFLNIASVNELKNMVALQGENWKDTSILKQNGFTLKTSTTFSTLLRMLSHKRGDYFPRGITEIQEELETFPNFNLTINDSIALHYPAAYYFFVSKDNLQLKLAVEKGLNIAIKDGSFDEIFMKYFGEIILQANLKNRTIFHLSNPNMPIKTPLNRKELWFSTDMQQDNLAQ